MSDDPFAPLKDKFLKSYASRIKGSQPLIKKAMVSAFSDGMNTIFQWILDVEARNEHFEKVKAQLEEQQKAAENSRG